MEQRFLSCELQHHKQDSDTMLEDVSQYSCDKLITGKKYLTAKCNGHSEKKKWPKVVSG